MGATERDVRVGIASHATKKANSKAGRIVLFIK